MCIAGVSLPDHVLLSGWLDVSQGSFVGPRYKTRNSTHAMQMGFPQPYSTIWPFLVERDALKCLLAVAARVLDRGARRLGSGVDQEVPAEAVLPGEESFWRY